MTREELDRLSDSFDAPNSGDQFRDMTLEERAEYEKRVNRGGRPRKAERDKVIKINVSLDPKILKLADAYAKRKKITRANLIETALVKLLGPSARHFDLTPRKRKSA